MRVAVVGGGMSGLAAALELAMAGVDEVVLYEKEQFLGGRRPPAVRIDGVTLDLGFLLFNPVRDLHITEIMEKLDVEMETFEMSFSLSLDEDESYEWGTRNGLASLFTQRTNVVNPSFWGLLREITNFKDDAIKYIQEHADNLNTDQIETLEHFVKSHRYSELFQKAYLTPICSSIWSCPLVGVMSFSAYSVLSFFHNYHLLQLFNQSQLLMVKCRSENYVDKVRAKLEHRSCNIKLGCEVKLVSSTEKGCSILASDLSEEFYDSCIISIHPLGALKILDKQITNEESRILGAFKYVYSDMYLHSDQVLMPRKQSAWSTWNFVETTQNGACITYWQNLLQKLEPKDKEFLITLSPPRIPRNKILKWTNGRVIPSVGALKASIELEKIQGKRKIWFCGSYQGFGFHEDKVKSGLAAADAILGMELKLLKAPRHMATSLMETGVRLIVTKFFQHFISTGSLMLLEGGNIFVFQGNNKRVNVKSILKVHNPSFYWKIAIEADIGLADALSLSTEQLKYAKTKVEEAGLEDMITLLLYRGSNMTNGFVSPRETLEAFKNPMKVFLLLIDNRCFQDFPLNKN
ncbi:hypothetical protein HPP92_014394 [Vanilla planifolia]|uniref:Amine oxidase domain-containing protein n=1 Tax=Vanilla planifolia TaxID=51239 RepID=A0A835QUC9_VANPL|nr:hypothetical protein HPP92_014394 [Vanilla planifolia]